MQSLISLIGVIAYVIFILVLIQFIINLLLQLDILNRRQPIIMQIYHGINQLLNPLLNPIRRILPRSGAIDLSPLVLLIGLWFLQVVLANNFT